MTVIRPNSVAGINSITVQSGNSLAVHKANGELIRTLTSITGVSTFSSISVGTATTDNSAAKSINIGVGASIAQHNDNALTFGTNGDPRITIDASGNFNVGSAATIKAGGNATFSGIVTATSFVGGLPITSGADNRIITASSASAIQGEANLTFNGGALSQTIDANDEGINITSSGAHSARLKVDTNQSSADDTIFFQSARWNSTEVASIHFRAGADTTNKDDGRLTFHTRPSGSSMAERLRIDESGRIGIQGAATRAVLDVRASGGSNTMLTAVFGANEGQTGGSLSDNADKAARVGSYHYDTDEEPFGVFVASGSNGTNNLTFGGGTSLMNAATAVSLYTAANSTTTNGTKRLEVDSNGDVLINQPAEASGRLTIKGTNSSGSSCYAVTDSGKAREGLDITCTTVGDGNFGGAISFGCGGNGRSAIAAYQEGADDDNNGLSFFTHVSNTGSDNNAERIRLLSSGRVYINPSTSVMPGNDPSGGGEANTNGFLNLRADNGENALGLLNTTVIANNSARGTVLTGINFINRNYYNSAGKAGTGYVIRNEKGHASYMDRCDLRLIPGYDGNTLYSNRSVVFEFDGAVRPGSDDYASLGTSSAKWTVVYATNGSIQTSDENLKQNIQSLSAAEMKAAASISKLFITYKWKSKVAKEEAGGDAARIHTGVIAQRIKAALEAEGLTAANYSFWCENITWKDSEGNIAGDGRKTGVGVYDELTGTTPSTDGYTKSVEYAVRYDELLSFVAAYNEQRFTSIESRLTALEGG